MNRSEIITGSFPLDTLPHVDLLGSIARVQAFADEPELDTPVLGNQQFHKQQLISVGQDLFSIVAALGKPFVRKIGEYSDEEGTVVEMERGMDMIRVLSLDEIERDLSTQYHSSVTRLITGHRRDIIHAAMYRHVFTKQPHTNVPEVRQVLTHSILLSTRNEQLESSQGWSMWIMDKTSFTPFSYPQNVSDDEKYILAWKRVARHAVDSIHEYLV